MLEHEISEDAKEELEALCAILPEWALAAQAPEDLLSPDGELHVHVAPEEEDEAQASGVPLRVLLIVSVLPPYPNDMPASLRVLPMSGVSDEACSKLMQLLHEGAQARVGMPMVLELFELARDYLRSVAGMGNEAPAAPETPEQRAAREEREAEERLEQARAAGTQVTYDNLAQLIAQLDHELELELDKHRSSDGRPTGKEIFLQQRNQREDDRHGTDEHHEEVEAAS